MERRRWLLLALTVVVAAILGVTTNYATAVVPDWLQDPWHRWPLLIIAVLLAALIETWPNREPAPPLVPKFTTTAPAALRRPSLDIRPHGRTAELTRLAKLAKSPAGHFAVVCGAGGMGKTTLAAWLAERAEQQGKAVFWIRWRDAESLTTQMIEVATTLGLPMGKVGLAQESGASLIDLVWKHLNATPNWLLVIDNVDHPQALSPDGSPLATYRGWVRPSKRGLLVVTSRDRIQATWGSAAELVDLTPLHDSAGAQVLLELAPHAGSPDDARLLSTRLGGLPLALHAAGTLLAQPIARIRTYASYTESADVLPENPDATKPEQARALIGHTWELSLDQLAAEGRPLARPLLRCLALLAEAPIPRELISPDLIPSTAPITPATIDASLAGLHQYGLIDAPARPVDTIVLHPLVRETSRLLVERAGNQESCSRHVENHVINFARELRVPGMIRLLAPHLITLPGLTSSDDARFKSVRDLLDAMANQCDQFGDYRTTVVLRQSVLDAEAAVLGQDHPDTFASLNNLGTALRKLGRFQEAADLHQHTLKARRRTLGDDHPDTLGSANNLGVALQRLGRFQEAADLHQHTLEARRRTLGDDHPETLHSQDNLGIALRQLGRFQEAADLHKRTLKARCRTVGDEHPDALNSQNNLGNALDHLGRFDEAAELHQRTLDTRRRTLGDDHPETRDSQNNLGLALGQLGRFQEAVDLHQRTLDADRRKYGEDHPDTLGSQNNLAVALANMGRFQEAAELHQRTLEAFRRVLGDDHPDTLASQNNLDETLRRVARRGGGRLGRRRHGGGGVRSRG